jgi:hypothetical protein
MTVEKVVCELEPAFQFVDRPTPESLGLDETALYSTAQVALILGEPARAIRNKVASGRYPGPATRGKCGWSLYTAAEIVEMVWMKRRHEAGLPVRPGT